MKNVIKAVKKLKLWSKKKRKKKTHGHEHPPHYCCSCYCSSSIQPSAPPLPSSSCLDFEYSNYGTFLPPPEPEPEPEPQPQEIASLNSSYQQYMVSVSEPVYGIPVPVIHASRTERSAGQFGCLFSFGSYLFRCLFPCFYIRQVV